MENNEEQCTSVNSGSSHSILSDLLPSDILEEIGVQKKKPKVPKVSISSNNLKCDNLNLTDSEERFQINNFKNRQLYFQNLNPNYMNYIGKINNYPKMRQNYLSSNELLILNNNNFNFKNNGSSNSLFYYNNNNNNNNTNKRFISNFNDNYQQNINNFQNNNFYMIWQNQIQQNINNQNYRPSIPIVHSSSSKNLSQMNIAFQMPKNHFGHRGSSTQIPVENNILSKDEIFDSQNNKEINNTNSSLIDSQIDNIFSQFQLNENTNQSHLYNLIEKIGSNLFLKIIKTHKGSRHLQKILSNNPPTQKEIDIIILIICMQIQDIICDYYGNYFLQKFFPYCSLKHRLLLYKYIKPNFLKIANDICGNHSLQCLILLQNSNEEENIIKECIENHLFLLSTGPNSSHVIQKVIKAIKECDREYINDFIISNLMELCLNPNGICIVKEFINMSYSEFYIMSIISIFEVETNKLTFNQFGNFGIQEIIKKCGESHCKKLINKLIDHIIVFSVSKFSSNVVDFVIDYLSKNNFRKFCHVIEKIFLDESNFNEMIKNKFGTYVIENCLELINKINDEFFENLKLKDDENNNSRSDNDEKMSFEDFIQFKNKIFSNIQNNILIKDKKKILKLIRD